MITNRGNSNYSKRRSFGKRSTSYYPPSKRNRPKVSYLGAKADTEVRSHISVVESALEQGTRLSILPILLPPSELARLTLSHCTIPGALRLKASQAQLQQRVADTIHNKMRFGRMRIYDDYSSDAGGTPVHQNAAQFIQQRYGRLSTEPLPTLHGPAVSERFHPATADLALLRTVIINSDTLESYRNHRTILGLEFVASFTRALGHLTLSASEQDPQLLSRTGLTYLHNDRLCGNIFEELVVLCNQLEYLRSNGATLRFAYDTYTWEISSRETHNSKRHSTEILLNELEWLTPHSLDCCESKLLNRWKITVHSRLPQLSIEGVEHNLSPRQLALYALFQQIAARAYSQCGGQLAMDLFVKALRTAHLTGQVSALVQATNNALGPGGFEFVSRVNFSEPTCLTLLQAWLAAAPLEQPEREQSREHIVALVG